jgi:hypothetical protein
MIFRGWLTSSGRKSKDIDGIEDRYQNNRYDVKHPDWTPKEKPVHLPACRSHLIKRYDWITMSPIGIEADALVVSYAERRGLKALMGLKDKDLKQAMETNYIDMNDKPQYRKIIQSTKLGTMVMKESLKGVKSLEADGFLLIASQTVLGDGADGYKGVKGVGAVAAYAMLEHCTTVEECCEALIAYYEKKFPFGHSYVDWSGKEQERTWQELLTQHMQLAYHERSGKDTSNPIGRYLQGDPIIY